MDDLGTITMCFPHVDKETKDILETLMNEAENYADFTERFCNKVCSEPSTLLLEYLDFFFPFHINDYNLTDRLVASAKVSALSEPLSLLVRVRRGEAISWKDMNQSLTKALKVAPNDWITSHLYLKWRYFAEGFYTETDFDMTPIEAISKSVNENPEFLQI